MEVGNFMKKLGGGGGGGNLLDEDIHVAVEWRRNNPTRAIHRRSRTWGSL